MKAATFKELEKAVERGEELPARVEDKLYVSLMECGSCYSMACTTPYKPTSNPVVFTVDVAFDVPKISKTAVVDAQVEMLEKERQAILANTEQVVQHINERIQSLRALEWQPEDQ